MTPGIFKRFMQCLKLLILAPVQIWTPLRILKWLLLLSLYEASRERGGERDSEDSAPGAGREGITWRISQSEGL
jgi:hypothetical protein